MPIGIFRGILKQMKNDTAKHELMAALDYILNRCTLREMDAIETAVDRRRRELEASTGIISLDPKRAAGKMTSVINESVNRSMEGMRRSLREFALNIISKEAPELTEEQADELIDSWFPPQMTGGVALSQSGRGAGSGRGASAVGSPGDEADPSFAKPGLARHGLVNGIPAEAMCEMVLQFVSYSAGNMNLSEQASLRDAVGDWTTIYWKKFPAPIQSAVRDFLAGAISADEFQQLLSELLR